MTTPPAAVTRERFGMFEHDVDIGIVGRSATGHPDPHALAVRPDCGRWSVRRGEGEDRELQR
jgi:hypothetical protein